MSGGIWGLSFPNAQTGYACTSTGTVLKTFNGGSLWGEQNTTLSENLYEIHFPSVQIGYIASWSGKILKTTNGGLTFLSNNVNEISARFSLEQNYPNPFNPTTSIRYAIPKNGFVKLIVFDALGREIESLVNETQSAGVYEVTFDAPHYSSGIYYYRLSAGDFVETKKMLTIK